MNFNFDWLRGLTVVQGLEFSRLHPDFRTAAIVWHGTQQYGIYPYAYHLSWVEYLLNFDNFTEYHFQASAWLHDVLEDTATTLQQITDMYGETVAGIVWACTGEGLNRAEKQKAILDKILKYPLAAPVKCADRLANIRFSMSTRNLLKLQMYVNEAPEFLGRIKPLMMNDRRSASLFSGLDETVERAKILCQQMQKAQAAESDSLDS